MSRIGLIGSGLLGTAIAERLLLAGHQVLGFDVSAERRAELQGLGGEVAASAVSVLQDCRQVVVSLPDSHIVREVLAGLTGHVDGQLIIDTTTGSPQDAEVLGTELARCGTEFVDATVAGSSEQTRRGEAIIMAGGSAKGFAGALPVLKCFSSRQFHTGPCGSGAVVKLIVNLVLGLNRAVLAEGLHLASRCDVDVRLILEILKSGPAYSRVMDTKGQKMISEDFSPQARLDQHRKDVGLILQMGSKHSARLPLSELHAELLQKASDLGFGTLDNSAIIRAFEFLSKESPPNNQ